MVEIIVDIYEEFDNFPVVTHVFRGRTAVAAKAVEEAHRYTDEFYNGAVTVGRWGNIKLRYESFVRNL